MPIFEYKCKKCGETFEFLERGNAKPQCPKCKSKSLEKLISGFGVGSGSTSHGACGEGCGHHHEHSGGCCCGGGHCCHHH